MCEEKFNKCFQGVFLLLLQDFQFSNKRFYFLGVESLEPLTLGSEFKVTRLFIALDQSLGYLKLIPVKRVNLEKSVKFLLKKRNRL